MATNHANYSKRAMALDQVEVMQHFGFDRFPVVGHDRGGRVAHRMALDHPDKVTKLAVLDIVPTYYLYTHVTIEFVQAYFHWFNYLRPAPGPENDLKAQYDAQRARRRIPRCSSNTCAPPAIPPTSTRCARTTAPAPRSISSTTRRTSRRRSPCPLLTLWGEKGPMGRFYDVLAIWRERGTTVTREADYLADTTCRKTCRTRCLKRFAGFCADEGGPDEARPTNPSP